MRGPCARLRLLGAVLLLRQGSAALRRPAWRAAGHAAARPPATSIVRRPCSSSPVNGDEGALSQALAASDGSCGDAIARIGAVFEARGVPEPELSARYLVAHSMGRIEAAYQLDERAPLGEDEAEALLGFAGRRLRREPVQYIVGDWDFHTINLLVRAPVLIPRPETEELVERVLGHVRAQGCAAAPLRILDACCGSGAIGLALLAKLPQATCVGIDLSAEAVALSLENARRLELSARYEAIAADACAPGWAEGETAGGFDVIVSNPPYIPRADMGELEAEVLRFEADEALCGGADGLDVARCLLAKGPQLFRPPEERQMEALAWFELDPSHLCREGSGGPEDTAFGRAVAAETGGAMVLREAAEDLFGRPRFGVAGFAGDA